MFDIGFWELVLISIIALVVLGPERLPHAIRTVARYVRTAKRMVNNVKEELSQELQIEELQKELNQAEQASRKMVNAAIEPVADKTSAAVNRQSSAADPEPTANPSSKDDSPQ